MNLHCKVGAVVVAYHPSTQILNNIRLLLPQVDQVIVVDNSTHASVLDSLIQSAPTSLTIVKNRKNAGVAAALNQGCSFLHDRECEWVVTMDQDSAPTEMMVSALLSSALACEEPEKVALVGARLLHPEYGERSIPWLARSRFPLLFRREKPDETRLFQSVDVVITSGSLTNLQAWRALGQFRNDFFIDYVDTEFCLRALKCGYRVLGCPRAKLFHHLGERKRTRALGYSLSPTNHSPIRRYYIARNSIPMFREYGFRFPHWATFDMCAGAVNAFRILMFESGRREKIRMSIRGFRDGLLGKMGALTDPDFAAEKPRG